MPCTSSRHRGGRGDADRHDEDVQDGPRRRQAEGRRKGRAARMVLQGQRLRRLWRPAAPSSPRPSRRMAARSRKWPASTSSPTRACRSASALPLSNEFSDHVTERDQLSLSRPFQAAPGELRSGNPRRRSAGRYSRHVAHHPRRQGDLRRSRSCRVRPTCPTASPISNITTSNTASSARRAMCMSICSARRRCPSRDGIKTEAGDVFEIEVAGIRPAAAQPAGRSPREEEITIGQL